MNSLTKHPKEVLDKVNFIEKKHKAILKKFLKEKKQYQPAYIYDEVLRGIILKKTNIVSFHPGSDSFPENIYYKISHAYYEIIRVYSGNHIEHLQRKVNEIKAKLIVSHEKHYPQGSQKGKDFIFHFNINQAINFISRDIAYRNMRGDAFFNTKTTQQSEHQDSKSPRSDNNPNLTKQTASEQTSHDILTASGAAELTGLSINTIRQKTSKNTIPHHKIPNSSAVRYSKRELLSWIESTQTLNTKSLLDGIQRNIRKKK